MNASPVDGPPSSARHAGTRDSPCVRAWPSRGSLQARSACRAWCPPWPWSKHRGPSRRSWLRAPGGGGTQNVDGDGPPEEHDGEAPVVAFPFVPAIRQTPPLVEQPQRELSAPITRPC